MTTKIQMIPLFFCIIEKILLLLQRQIKKWLKDGDKNFASECTS